MIPEETGMHLTIQAVAQYVWITLYDCGANWKWRAAFSDEQRYHVISFGNRTICVHATYYVVGGGIVTTG